MKTKLNYKEIEGIDPSDKKQKKALGEGLILWISPLKANGSGGKKYFVGQYRVPNNRNLKYYQIGVFGNQKGQFTPAQAIEYWRGIKLWAKENNKTPKDFKLLKKKELFSNLEKPTLIEAVGNFLQITEGKIKPTTHIEYRNKLNQILEHIDGDTPLEELETANGGKKIVNAALKKIAGGTKYDLENRCRFLLHRTFELAEELDLMNSNPVTTNKKFFNTPDPNQHHPTIEWEEVPRFLRAIEVNPCNSSKSIVLATKLLLLTGLRTGALTRLKWEWIKEDEQDGKVIVIPPLTSGLKRKRGKNDHIPHKVPVTPEIETILEQVREFNFWNGSNSLSEIGKYIFLPIKKSRFPHLDPSSINNFFRNLGFKGRLRAHGWRRTFLTAGIDQLKADRDVIRRQMGHLVEGKVLQAYDFSERLEERREFLENWGTKLVEMGLRIS